jgi:large subunit ribosomal protein L4
MSKLSVYNQEGKAVGDIELSDKIFGVKPNPALVHEVMVGLQANARKVIANAKTRGEVRGGGKKPWKQKGTGRARQGSIRAPNWVGGGIVFGPTSERNFSVKINKKAKRAAFHMALSDKLAQNGIVVVDGLKTDPAKTKTVAAMLKNLPVQKTQLLIAPASNPALVRMVRNLPNAKVVTANTVSLLDILKYRSVVFLKDAVPVFEKIYA